MQKLLPFVVGVDGGEALHTGGDVGEERGLRDIVQTLQLSNQDPGERTSSVSAGREQIRAILCPGGHEPFLFTWTQCAELQRG